MKTHVLSAALLAVAGPLTAATEARRSYSASAYSLQGDELLYVERHVELWREGRLAERQVRYLDPAGELIAEKSVRYGEAPAAPSFEMTDYRLGLREGAEVDAGEIVLFSGPTDVPLRPRTFEKPPGAVVDAGFDVFLRDNFEAVKAGEKVEFEFAVPAARRFFRFQLVPEGEVTYRDEPAFLVKMRPASKLLRLAMDPIELVYSPDGRLLEFRGMANVCDEDGLRYRARIAFDYPDRESASLRVGAAQ